MTPRICGTCTYARDLGGGHTVCTHEEGRRWTVITTTCRQPRRWWRERVEPIRAVEVAARVEPDQSGQMRLVL